MATHGSSGDLSPRAFYTELAHISPQAWHALDAALRNGFAFRQRPPQGKSWLTQKLLRDHYAECERRRQQGQAAIALAVQALLTSHSPQP